MATTELELTDRDFKGPDGSRYSNFHLFLEQMEAGCTFDENGDSWSDEMDPWWGGRNILSRFETQVFQEEDMSGRTHEWRLVHNELQPWEMNQPQAAFITLYESEYAHQGPEEGGWGATVNWVVGVIVITDIYNPENRAAAEELATVLCDMRNEYIGSDRHGESHRAFWQAENVFGHRHTVGSFYYC